MTAASRATADTAPAASTTTAITTAMPMQPAAAPWPRMRDPGEIIAEWECPVCAAPCHRRYQAGRPRVYCTNACRQRAYRWRCANRTNRPNRTNHATSHPHAAPERARTRDRTHALRPHSDFVAGRRDSTGRQITACGAFSRPDRDRSNTFWHTEFMTGSPWACTSCARLLRVPDIPIDEVIERALAHAKRGRHAPSNVR
jgi:hypothetical protein